MGKRALKYWLTSQDNYNTDPFTTRFSRVNGVFFRTKRVQHKRTSHVMVRSVHSLVAYVRVGAKRRSRGAARLRRRSSQAHPELTLGPLVCAASAAKTSACDGYWLGAAIEIRRLRANNSSASKQIWIMGCVHRRERCGGGCIWMVCGSVLLRV